MEYKYSCRQYPLLLLSGSLNQYAKELSIQEVVASVLTPPGFLLLLIVDCDVLSAVEWQANEAVSQQNYHKGMRKELKPRQLEIPALGAEHHY